MTDNLKPCPFCANRAVRLVDDGYSNYWVQCSNCFAQSDAFLTRYEAVRAWNNRADSTAISSDAWNNALYALVQAISDISKLIKEGEKS